jgi:hypothetical protein
MRNLEIKRRVVPARLTVKRLKYPIHPEILQYFIGQEAKQTFEALTRLLEIALYHSSVELNEANKPLFYRVHELCQTLNPA